GLMIAPPVEQGRRQTALNVVETKRGVNFGNLKFESPTWPARTVGKDFAVRNSVKRLRSDEKPQRQKTRPHLAPGWKSQAYLSMLEELGGPSCVSTFLQQRKIWFRSASRKSWQGNQSSLSMLPSMPL